MDSGADLTKTRIIGRGNVHAHEVIDAVISYCIGLTNEIIENVKALAIITVPRIGRIEEPCSHQRLELGSPAMTLPSS